MEGNLPTDVTYVVTTTSYEASSLLVREVFPGLDNIGLLFPDRPGDLDQLIENYLETFNKKVGVDIKRSDLNDDQAYILGTHIYTKAFQNFIDYTLYCTACRIRRVDSENLCPRP